MIDLEHFTAYLDVLGLVTCSVVTVIVRHLLVYLFLEGTPLGAFTLLPGHSGSIQ